MSGALHPLTLRFLGGYPEPLLEQVRALIAQQRLGELLARRYPERHDVRSERALWDYVQELKARHMRSAGPLAAVAWDPQLQRAQQALGVHRAVSRVQGSKLKARREIRIAAVFKEAPAAFLHMIVVHELAHLREREHDKAFYQLCCHMAPDYHQLEFDTRLWLTQRALEGAAG